MMIRRGCERRKELRGGDGGVGYMNAWVGFCFLRGVLGFFIIVFFLFSSEYERKRGNERDIMTACTHIYTHSYIIAAK